MPDKRTFDLDSIDVNVALINGILVVDTATLAGADAEQQKILIDTLLSAFALSGKDFYIDDLQINPNVTANNNIRNVMLSDGSGYVRVRDVGAFLEGTQAVKTNITFPVDEESESYLGHANSQKEINEQNAAEFANVYETIASITELGAAATVYADPTPQPATTTEAELTFSTLFDTSNENVIEVDETLNRVTLKATGIYQNAVYLQIANADSSTTHMFYLRMRNADTDEIISETEIEVYKDGYSGTWINRYAITAAPVTVYYSIESSDASDLTLTDMQINIISVSNGSIPMESNPFIIDVFGVYDNSLDTTAIEQAIAQADDNYIIRFFGRFRLENQAQIIISGKNNLTLDFTNSYFYIYQSSVSNAYTFRIDNCNWMKVFNFYCGYHNDSGVGKTIFRFGTQYFTTVQNIKGERLDATEDQVNIVTCITSTNYYTNVLNVHAPDFYMNGAIRTNFTDCNCKYLTLNTRNIIKGCRGETVNVNNNYCIVTNCEFDNYVVSAGESTLIMVNNTGQYINGYSARTRITSPATETRNGTETTQQLLNISNLNEFNVFNTNNNYLAYTTLLNIFWFVLAEVATTNITRCRANHSQSKFPGEFVLTTTGVKIWIDAVSEALGKFSATTTTFFPDGAILVGSAAGSTGFLGTYVMGYFTFLDSSTLNDGDNVLITVELYQNDTLVVTSTATVKYLKGGEFYVNFNTGGFALTAGDTYGYMMYSDVDNTILYQEGRLMMSRIS